MAHGKPGLQGRPGQMLLPNCRLLDAAQLVDIGRNSADFGFAQATVKTRHNAET